MQGVAKEAGLSFGEDVKYLGLTGNMDLLDEIVQTNNQTVYHVGFCQGEFEIPSINKTIPCYFLPDAVFYNIIYNTTRFYTTALMPMTPAEVDPSLIGLLTSIDTNIAKTKGKPVEINNTYRSSPTCHDQFKSIDPINYLGQFLYVLPPFLMFVILLMEIVKEKENSLRRVHL